MCYEDGQLMSFLDGESEPEERVAIEEHLASCASCTEAVTRLAADRDAVAPAFAALHAAAVADAAAPAPTPVPSAAECSPEPPKEASLLARIGWTRIAAAAAAVLFAASFSFAPVRSMAAAALRVFRVNRVQTISFTAEDAQRISETLSKGEGNIDLEELGDISVEGGSAEQKTVTLAEASKAVDFEIRLPEGMTATPTIHLQPAQTYAFTLNVDKINELLAYYGSERTLPESVDGKTFTVRIPPVVVADYGMDGTGVAPKTPNDPTDPDDVAMSGAPIAVGQARSPELIVPDGVDMLELRDVLVNLPFLPENVRDQLASVNDWQNTMLIPSLGGSSRDIDLDGVPAVVIGEPKASGAAAAGQGQAPEFEFNSVVWNDDGVVRVVGGTIDEETAIRMAKSMLR